MTNMTIAPEERGLATMTHLSGLAGYIAPFGGVAVPIIIWLVKKDSPVISSIAKQAILLNIVVFILVIVCIILSLTIVLAPLMFLLGITAAICAFAFPIVGAVKANDGTVLPIPDYRRHAVVVPPASAPPSDLEQCSFLRPSV